MFYLHVCMYTMCMHCLQRSEGIRSPGTRVTDSCEPLYGCQGQNQQVPLTAVPYLYPPYPVFKVCIHIHSEKFYPSITNDKIMSYII